MEAILLRWRTPMPPRTKKTACSTPSARNPCKSVCQQNNNGYQITYPEALPANVIDIDLISDRWPEKRFPAALRFRSRLSATWRSASMDPPPLPLGETLMDKIADRLPIHVWPVAQWFFYLLALLESAFLVALAAKA